MIGEPNAYLHWVLNDNNGYLPSQAVTQWEELVVASGLQASRVALQIALARHLPEGIPDALHQDPELDLGGYWLGIPNARVAVEAVQHPFTGNHPEHIDLEEWFGRKLTKDSDESGSSVGSNDKMEEEEDDDI
jgi:hypothetical protein